MITKEEFRAQHIDLRYCGDGGYPIDGWTESGNFWCLDAAQLRKAEAYSRIAVRIVNIRDQLRENVTREFD